MKRSFFVIIMFAVFAAALLTGCTGQRGGSDTSVSWPSATPAADANPGGRGVEDPNG